MTADGLTLIEPRITVEPAIARNPVEVSHRTTVNARETVERMNKTTSDLHQELRAVGRKSTGRRFRRNGHLATQDTVKRSGHRSIANAYGFLKTLDWGGVTACFRTSANADKSARANRGEREASTAT